MLVFTNEIIQTILVIAFFVLSKVLINLAMKKASIQFQHHKTRVKIVKKIIHLLLIFISTGFILFIWGVKQSELLFFITSLLTVLGIAFFAQWSIISNITSTLIIFFSHPARIGDQIMVLDKDFSVEGTISDIGAFFVKIKTANGEIVTVPSNLFIQKMIQIKSNH